MDVVLSFLAQQPVLLLFTLVGVGSLLGRVTVRGVSLGAAAVLFLAIALGALGRSRDLTLEVPETLGTLGLTLFTFTIGLVSGATFFASLRRSVGPILTMVGVAAVAAATAVGVGRLVGLDAPTVAGAFAGAVTNTPALAAAREAAGGADAPTVGYAVTYLVGVLGMLFTVSLALRHRAQDTDSPPELVNRTVRVEVATAPSIREIETRFDSRITFSRVRHGEQNPIRTAEEDDTLRLDDLVTVVGPKDAVEAVTAELGHTSSHHLDADRQYVDMRRITVSNPRAAGRTIGELGLAQKFGATVSRVRRGDVDQVASDDFLLQLGDRVRVIAPKEQMAAVSTFFGDSSRGLSDITPVLLGLGMVAGILLGSVAFPVPGRVFSIGSAAGTLLIGLVLGRIGRIGPLVTTMPYTAAQAIAEFGLLLFLAQAGSRAGGLIGQAFTSGEWMRILVVGVAVAAVFCAGLYVAMRRVFVLGGTQTAGVLAGAQTQPAILAFANGRTGYDPRVALGYALVYPAAMIAKILLGQILGGL